MSEALRKEGISRELINRIQNLRKDNGFEVTDKVVVNIYASGNNKEEIEVSLAEYCDYVASQTLALSVCLYDMKEAPDNAPEVEWDNEPIKILVFRKH